jgi:hypothetical protein
MVNLRRWADLMSGVLHGALLGVNQKLFAFKSGQTGSGAGINTTVTGLSVGDLVLAAVASNSGTVTPPAGWNDLGYSSALGSPVIRVAYRIATATSLSTGTFSTTGGTQNRWAIAVFQGATGMTAAASFNSGTSATVPMPAVSVGGAKATVHVVASGGTVTSRSVPAGYTVVVTNSLSEVVPIAIILDTTPVNATFNVTHGTSQTYYGFSASVR